MKYISVIVDNNTDATDNIYTYKVEDDDLSLLSVGRKVKVPFGIHNRESDAYIVEIQDEAPEGVKKIKSILSVDPYICLSEEAINTALWMRNRYICRYIEALSCFLPVAESKRKTKDPFENIELSDSDKDPKALTAEQQEAFEAISESLVKQEHKCFLLKGVTGSGKTEVYLQSVAKAMEDDRFSIILVPEISLTPQLVARFMSRFGKEKVAVLHSKLTPAQRSTEYKRIEKGDVGLVIGARSAIFAPFKNIGLIVLDEEHESSYKSDKSPKYDTIEIATKRAMAHNAVLVLGSATPSVSDYYRAKQGLFTLLEINNRYNGVELPESEIVDMTSEIKSGNRSPFSVALVDAISDQLNEKKQVILFLNRRGYSSYVSCRDCGYVVKCNECGIAMPYHKDEGLCRCHYCDRKQRKPSTCPECGSKYIGGYGVGTQQIEEKIAELFPTATADRLDFDNIQKKGELENTLKRFEKKKTDILIGTQLVAKGLDFDNVGLVGVINADTSLNIPDFRSQERSFQLLTQAAGRAGRGDEGGKVIIQTYSPDSETVISASNQDYDSFYENEIAIRKATGYPPFSIIYQLLIMDPDSDFALRYAKHCVSWLRKELPGLSVLGPAAPALQKSSGMYRYQVLIKANPVDRKTVSNKLRLLKDNQNKDKNSAKLLTIDINPFSFI